MRAATPGQLPGQHDVNGLLTFCNATIITANLSKFDHNYFLTLL